MANKKEKDPKIDALLKQVLQDDPPPETERKMKLQFIRFKKNIERARRAPERTSKALGQSLFQARSWDWLSWAVRKEVLAFSSMIMIAVGGFLHVSGHPNAMAETLSFVNTSFSISNQLREVQSMECSLQFTSEEGLHLHGTIRWLSPEIMRADVYEGDRASKSLWIEGSEILVADLVNHTNQKYHSLEQIEDPVFTPLMEFLSPENLGVAIYKKWEPRHYREQDKGRNGTYVYQIEGGKATLEMTVDENTHLPLSIKKFSLPPQGAAEAQTPTLEAQFLWNNLNE
ncbi:MAG TPA: hypothetical protein VGB72_07840 [Acidobacteriota bacterium]